MSFTINEACGIFLDEALVHPLVQSVARHSPLWGSCSRPSWGVNEDLQGLRWYNYTQRNDKDLTLLVENGGNIECNYNRKKIQTIDRFKILKRPACRPHLQCTEANRNLIKIYCSCSHRFTVIIYQRLALKYIILFSKICMSPFEKPQEDEKTHSHRAIIQDISCCNE